MKLGTANRYKHLVYNIWCYTVTSISLSTVPVQSLFTIFRFYMNVVVDECITWKLKCSLLTGNARESAGNLIVLVLLTDENWNCEA
jgi:hypothetical protein